MVSYALILCESIIFISETLITDWALHCFVYEEYFHKHNKKYAVTSIIVLISKIACYCIGNKSSSGVSLRLKAPCIQLQKLQQLISYWNESWRDFILLRANKVNKNSNLLLSTFLSEVGWWETWCKWSGTKHRGSTWLPWSSNYAGLGLTWVSGRSLRGEAVGSSCAAGSLEAAMEWWETREEAESSTLVIQRDWLQVLLHWEHLRMKFRSDHSWRAAYLQLFLLSCR